MTDGLAITKQVFARYRYVPRSRRKAHESAWRLQGKPAEEPKTEPATPAVPAPEPKGEPQVKPKKPSPIAALLDKKHELETQLADANKAKADLETLQRQSRVATT